MINTKNIILIASITAVLGLGSVALQTNTITVDALMDNTSEILDIGEKSEITTLAKPEGGGGKKTSLVGKYEVASDDNIIKCSASNILSCTIKNSVDGLEKVTLGANDVTCVIKDVKDGASRASINTRKVIANNSELCKYNLDMEYKLIGYVAGDRLGLFDLYMVSFDALNALIVIMPPNNN